MVDSAADAESSRLGNALVELETEGIAYGDLSLTISLCTVTRSRPSGWTATSTASLRPVTTLRRSGKGTASWPPGSAACRRSRGNGRCDPSLFRRARRLVWLRYSDRRRGNPAERHTCGATRWRYWKRNGERPTTTILFHGDVGHTLILGATGAGKILHVELSARASLAVRSRACLILDLGGSYRWLTRFLGGGYLELSPDNPDGERRLPVAALRAAGRRANLSVFDRMDHTPAPHRRLAGERGRSQRNPRPHRRPVRIRTGSPHLGSAGSFPALEDVARAGALARRGRLGKILRQPGWRDGTW